MVVTAARRVPATALCALAAHALVYRTFSPGDAAHGYFDWYEPLVGILSLGALVVLLVLFAVAALARPLRPATTVSPRSLALASFVFLVGQETLERSLAAGSFVPASFTPSGWLLLLVGVAAASLLLTAALRLCRAAVELLLGEPPALRRAHALGWSLVPSTLRPLRPLAAHRALRAPPLLAG